jgi:ribosomal protein L29
MKKKELVELKTRDVTELNKLLKEKRVEFAKSRLDLKASREKNLKKARNLRRGIAQILTIIREKELVEQESKKVEEREKKDQNSS